MELEWSEDSYMDPSPSLPSSAISNEDRVNLPIMTSLGGGTSLVKGPGPVAEGFIRLSARRDSGRSGGEEGSSQNQLQQADAPRSTGRDSQRRQERASSQPTTIDFPSSFASRVASWFSSSSTGGSPSEHGSHAPSSLPHATGRIDLPPNSTEVVSEAHSESSGYSRVNSFSYAAGQQAGGTHSPTGSGVTSISTFGGRVGLVGGKAVAKGRSDPAVDEVRSAEFSLKIMVGAGRCYAFHVGGSVEATQADVGGSVGGSVEATQADASLPEVPHWEFFIADRCVGMRSSHSRLHPQPSTNTQSSQTPCAPCG